MLTPDWWDSAAFTSIFLALSFFYISSLFHARPHAGTPAVNCNDIRHTFCELESSKTRLNLAFSDDLDM